MSLENKERLVFGLKPEVLQRGAQEHFAPCLDVESVRVSVPVIVFIVV